MNEVELTRRVKHAYEVAREAFENGDFDFPHAFAEFEIHDTAESRRAFYMGVACSAIVQLLTKK